jgi:tetratricopeptide (TPR) repeat protein
MLDDMIPYSKKLIFSAGLIAIVGGICPAIAHAAADPRDQARLAACIAKIDKAPEEAYEDGLIWRSQSGGAFAEQCVALAKVALGDTEAGAARLAGLASAPDAGDSDQRTLLLAKAANAWLMIGRFEPALRALNAALVLKPAETDLLIDRARSFAGLSQWSKARDDLTLALSKRPTDALSLRLRAETYLQQGQYDAAEADIALALRIGPRDIENHVMRGRASEARRLGRPPG